MSEGVKLPLRAVKLTGGTILRVHPVRVLGQATNELTYVHKLYCDFELFSQRLSKKSTGMHCTSVLTYGNI